MHPNLFCIGFPKCGTTSLANYLIKSEEVYIPKIKEPGYFLKTDPNVSVRSKTQYQRLYKGRHEKYLGDFTVTYIYDREAISEVEQLGDKYICLMRNPNKAAQSMFNFNNRLGGETTSYRQALEDEPLRLQGKQLPRFVKNTGTNILRCCYRTQFDYPYWLQLLPEKILSKTYFSTMEHMVGEQNTFKSELSAFLDIETVPEMIPHSNIRQEATNRIGSLIAYPPYPLSNLKTFIKKHTYISDTKIMNLFYSSLSSGVADPRDEVIPLFDIRTVKDNLAPYGVKGLDRW